MINSFGIEIPQKDANGNLTSTQVLSVTSVLDAAIPAIANTNTDVKNAAIKIVLDV